MHDEHAHDDGGDLPQVLGSIRAGRLRALAVGSALRDAALPEVPAFAEAGLSGVQSQSWHGVVVKSGTPPETVQRLHAAISAALDDPRLRRC